MFVCYPAWIYYVHIEMSPLLFRAVKLSLRKATTISSPSPRFSQPLLEAQATAISMLNAWICYYNRKVNKQEAHGQQCLPEKQSINTSVQSYDYTIAIKERELLSPSWELNGPLFIKTWIPLNPLHTELHWTIFGWNWPNGSGEANSVIIFPWERAKPFVW